MFFGSLIHCHYRSSMHVRLLRALININQSLYQSIDQSIEIDRSIDKSINQSINQ